jgi:hypothetical protein
MHRLIVFIGGEKEHTRGRTAIPDGTAGVHSAAAPQADVHQYHIRVKTAGLNYGIRVCPRFADYFDTALAAQYRPQSLSNDFVIVYDQHADWF